MGINVHNMFENIGTQNTDEKNIDSNSEEDKGRYVAVSDEDRGRYQ